MSNNTLLLSGQISSRPLLLKTEIKKLPRILILGVNPFEDVPGYQVISVLQSAYGENIVAADDSENAVQILRHAGIQIHKVPHPCTETSSYLDAIQKLCEEEDIELILPASDSHLSTLIRNLKCNDWIARACPYLTTLSSMALYDKFSIQNWLSSLGTTPKKWRFRDDDDLFEWEKSNQYPVMVKGLRKGGIKCDDKFDVIVARRQILENPMNQGPYGGVYLEGHIEGEEHSMLIVIGSTSELEILGLRKLATTKHGTTVAAVIESMDDRIDEIRSITRSLGGPCVVEIESRLDEHGQHWYFEANFRFPSWIGSLSSAGFRYVNDFLLTMIDGGSHRDINRVRPKPGTLIYRLPQSGTLPLNEVFIAKTEDKMSIISEEMRQRSPKLLWRGNSPHQYFIK